MVLREGDRVREREKTDFKLTCFVRCIRNYLSEYTDLNGSYSTVCPSSLGPVYIVGNYIKLGKTS